MEQLKIVLYSLWQKHNDFFDLYIKALMFSNSRTSSLLSMFFLVYFVHIIRKIMDKLIVLRVYCLSGRICREILFHIGYFYFTRAWFYLMKAIRTLTDYIEATVLERHHQKEIPYDLRTIMSVFYACVFSIIFVMTVLYERVQPGRLQYFTWIAGPRWVVTEMGTSARLLVVEEQIPRIQSTQEPSYQTQRSTSAEYIRKKPSRIPRYTQSELIKPTGNYGHHHSIAV